MGIFRSDLGKGPYCYGRVMIAFRYAEQPEHFFFEVTKLTGTGQKRLDHAYQSVPVYLHHIQRQIILSRLPRSHETSSPGILCGRG